MLIRSAVSRVAVCLVAVTALAAGCASEKDPTPPKTQPTASAPSVVTFAVYGPAPVVAAYKQIAARFTAAHPSTTVEVQSYATHDAALKALATDAAQGDPPDLFLIDHDDLSGLAARKSIRHVDDLLTDREVDFGDGFSRTGLEAFSSDATLQCMPSDVSPLVVYYNPKLIELDTIAELGRNPVNQKNGWSLDEFARGALQARAPGVRGLYIAPNLEQVAPFIWSGGGEVVDDTAAPTTLTLSDAAAESALEKLLVVVRDPALTFNQAALRRQSALARFEAGRLGMILGFRDLTPELRAQANLTFDVMPLPRVGGGDTIASMQGLCLSATSQQTSKAADLLAAVISDTGAKTLASTGYAMPSNLDVLNSDEFLQTGQRPLNSGVFAREVRNSHLLPTTPQWAVVRDGAAQQLTSLFYDPVILTLPERLAAMDAASVPLLRPTPAPSGSPSPSG